MDFKRLAQLNDWRRTDPEIASMVTLAVASGSHQSLAHLADTDPEMFEALYEAAEQMVELDKQ